MPRGIVDRYMIVVNKGSGMVLRSSGHSVSNLKQKMRYRARGRPYAILVGGHVIERGLL